MEEDIEGLQATVYDLQQQLKDSVKRNEDLEKKLSELNVESLLKTDHSTEIQTNWMWFSF